jgi:hypothetical protein
LRRGGRYAALAPRTPGERPRNPERRRLPAARRSRSRAYEVGCSHMPATWIWMQIAIVVFVLIGMIIAITKLA